jgi:hypothetical protein
MIDLKRSLYNTMVKKKKKEKFESFRSEEKSPYKTIKIPLKTILLNHKDDQLVVNELVFEMNDLVIHSYQFIRLYILHCYTTNKPLPVIDEQFISYCIKTLGVKSNSGRKKANTELVDILEKFYIEEYQPLLQHKKTDLIGKTQLILYLSIQIYTILSVNCQEHFIQHFRRFINITLENEDKNELHIFKNNLLKLEDTYRFSDWQEAHLHNILPDNIQKSVHYDVKVRPLEYLKGMLYMNSILEKKGVKLFQPLPLRTDIIPKHILIDTASLISLFCPETDKDGKKILKYKLLEKLKENQSFIWDSFFNMKHKVFKNNNYIFHNQIQTDGIICSLLFIRKDLKHKKYCSKVPIVPEQEFHTIQDLSDEQLEAIKDRNIIGCDPGKRSLVYMVDKDGNKLQFTAAQRRMESTQKHNQKIMNKEKKRNKITEKETELSSHNSKSVDYQKFKDYLVAKDKLNKETIEFYKRETWRKMRFRTYSYGKKSIDNFLNRIKKAFGDNLLIAYGDWSRSTQMKNYIPTMNKALRKVIHKKYDTISINEHNTSKKCCDCHNDLEYYYDDKGKKVFRLLKCVNCVSSKNKQTVFKTRDVNAATNIMRLAVCWIENRNRPEAFQKPPSTVGKS